MNRPSNDQWRARKNSPFTQLFCRVVLASVFLASQSTYAFKIDFPVFGEPNHEEITGMAATSLNFSSLAIQALKATVRAVDLNDCIFTLHPCYRVPEPSDALHHFDDGKIRESRDYVGTASPTLAGWTTTGLWNNVQEGLHVWNGSRLDVHLRPEIPVLAGQQTLTNLGMILHANQDFYSHSNYVELMLTIGSFSFGSQAALMPLPLWDRTIFPPLTLFYYQDWTLPPTTHLVPLLSGVFPEPLFGANECVNPSAFLDPYFGTCRNRIGDTLNYSDTLPYHEALNKDSSTSREGSLHAGFAGSGGPTFFDLAFDLAQRQTQQDLQTFLMLSGSPSGADFLNALDMAPEFVEELIAQLDPSNPSFHENYQRMLNLDVVTLASTPAIPIPPTIPLLALGLAGLALSRRKRT